jgi:predicted RND superfamily exporter protein
VQSLRQIYEDIVLRKPVATLLAIAAFSVALGWYAQYFSLDASADSLTLERDADLEFYRYVRARYDSDDFLLITYTPQEPLFEDAQLDQLRAIRDELAAIPDVESVTTILDVPLVASPPANLRDIASGIRYLEDEAVDTELARNELLASPLYEDLLISSDGKTTAIRVDFRRDLDYRAMRDARNALREKEFVEGLTAEEQAELAELSIRFDNRTRELLAQLAMDVERVRTIAGKYQDRAELHIGGVPMIVSDSMDFIRHDLLVFGIAVLIFLVLILGISFSQARWVFLPLATCATTCLLMLGLLGRFDWRVTVVSSNFLSLVLILCLALTLHLIVRYREVHEANPDATQFDLVSKTIRRIVEPCLFTALTTIVAFGSLVVSGIRPVIDFGYMMSIGIVVAFILSFTLFPAVLMLLKPGTAISRNDLTAAITRFFARLIHRHGHAVLLGFAALVIAGLAGTTKLTVENRFIDYYKESTEIYRGMELIDRELGGTTPLDVIIDAPPVEDVPEPDPDYEEEFEDIYADETDAEAGITSRSYWFNSYRLPEIDAIHDYLESLHDTGKVLSLATFAEVIGNIDADVLQDNFALSVIYEKLPEDVRESLFGAYLSEDGDQLRFSVRVFESDPSLERADFLRTVENGLTEGLGYAPSQVRLSGMLVLYNNMLQSLFRSQIVTLGAVFLAIMIMFLILFRSLRTAVIAVVPNLASACLILGLMGWLGIPLDLMTITIAAITVGIGVDDTIHYVHRYRREILRDGDPWAAVFRCHRSIGRAIYYTSVTIMLGFSILAFSSFIPTIYFGLLTSFAMLTALVANMTLLPLLIVKSHAMMNTVPDAA